LLEGGAPTAPGPFVSEEFGIFKLRY